MSGSGDKGKGKLKVEIPGFYYDEEKGRYFRVEKKSTPRDHPYRPDNIKKKEQLKEKQRLQSSQKQQQQLRKTTGLKLAGSQQAVQCPLKKCCTDCLSSKCACLPIG